ncbi:helix-turn-helix domain-containing protein [Maribellus mangrovi]|uniref:helix-turn-helix domain-containing protein n=1 Tax=Maribellus mangrovi TaxID=3133146 RepID=UPI0030ECA59E
MEFIEDIKRPSKQEQKTAMESYDALVSMLKELDTENPEIEIEETSEKIRIPLNALKLLAKILEETSKGRPVSIVPIATEMTTQAAAELLGCSRPHLIKLLEKGEIQFTKVGKHRRIRYEDIIKYKKEMKARQKQLLIDIMKSDEESGLYDT